MFATLAQNIRKIEPMVILRSIMTESNIQEWIKDTVTGRLFNDGITGSLKKLQTDSAQAQGNPAYSMFTTIQRERNGKQTSHVDLFHEGDLHKSFKVTLKEWGWSQNMNFNNPKYKTDIADNFRNMYSNPDEFYNDVESMTDDELSELIIEKIYPLFIQKFNEFI